MDSTDFYLKVSVYRNTVAHVDNWLLDVHKSVPLIGSGITKIDKKDRFYPALQLCEKTVMGKKYLRAIPFGTEEYPFKFYKNSKKFDDKLKILTFGGTFVHSSDARFFVLNNGYPIPVFDRISHE